MTSSNPSLHQLIHRFSAAGERLRQAIQGMDISNVKVRATPNESSIHELVIYLSDEDAIAIDSMKRIIAEENPTLWNLNESTYTDRLLPHEQSLQDALLLFETNRRQFARVLRHLPEDEFQRCGNHVVDGQQTLEQVMRLLCDHFDQHLEQLHEKRDQLADYDEMLTPASF